VQLDLTILKKGGEFRNENKKSNRRVER